MDNANIQRPNAAEQNYTVVARRYRPRSFEQLIGQDHVSQALSKAIATGRVGHAYLFTGARGVGKTSTARIFAKALNAGDDAGLDIAKDISEAIDSGEDMDVIEIDGASNRGIEEIRQLRANVNVRPSRAKYKIYIIDEVHMLTNQAFNALLKTLEEPPGHVKFIFCTTDPDKLPITVLSRCQRFDFAPVKFESILQRLEEIVAAEGFEADRDALGLLARRAAGSMRDSQSLLEQVMSFASGKITVEQINALLGTADEAQLLELVEALQQSNGLLAIELVDRAVRGGADAGQLAEQLLNYLRDVMAIGVGAGPHLLKLASPTSVDRLRVLAKDWGLQTILAAIQLLDESLVRMRGSVSATTLMEVALIQICQLEHMSTVSSLLDAILQRGAPMPLQEKKKPELIGRSQDPVSASAATREVTTAVSPVANASRPSNLGDVTRADIPSPHLDIASANTASTGRGPSAATSRLMALAAAEPTSATERFSPAAPQQSVVEQISHPLEQPSRSHEPTAAAAKLQAANPPSGAFKQSLNTSTATLSPLAKSSTADTAATSIERSQAIASVSGPASPADAPRNLQGSPQALADWQRAIKNIQGMLADLAGLAVVVEPVGSSAWNILFPPGAHKPREFCETPQRKAELTAAVQETVGRPIQLSFAVIPGEIAKPVTTTSHAAIRAKRLRELSDHPFIKFLCEALEGEILRVDPPRS